MANDFGIQRVNRLKKIEADRLKQISIGFLKQNGLLTAWSVKNLTWTRKFTDEESSIRLSVSAQNENGFVHFFYTQIDSEGESKVFDYQVPLTTTTCRFGGKRYWFRCPFFPNGQYCGRRVCVLYKAGEFFACRHCYNLTYSSRNENRRSKNFALFNTLMMHKKIYELQEKIKHPYYAGKPTKKQQRLDKLCERATRSYANLEL